MSTNLCPRTWVASLALFLNIGAVHPVFAQGSLTPPGAPAPTMKTLDQVEPRTAITNVPFDITNSGSYFLTRSFQQSYPFYAINILTNNVTLDLCGFTISKSGTNSAAGIQITTALNAYRKNITVRNGIITAFTNGSGVIAFGPRNCVFENLTVTDCSNFGILLQANGTAGAINNVVRNCRLCDSGTGLDITLGAGNIGNVIDHCEALNNTGDGFEFDNPGNLIVNCRATGNGSDFVIAAGNRSGQWVLPATNSATIFPPSSGPGSGTTDPFANVSY
jgi:hypothetical protein